MIIVFITVISITIFYLLFVNMQIKIRDFRFELFKIRDEVRYAFIREISTATPNEKVALRESFSDFQELLNSMIRYPTLSQAVILKSMLEKTDKEEENRAVKEFNALPMLFQRQMIFLAQSLIKSMGMETTISFIGFLFFRLSLFSYLELLAIRCEGRLNQLDKTVIEKKERIVLPNTSQVWGQRKQFKHFKNEPIDLAENIMANRKKIQDTPPNVDLVPIYNN